jgi:hypothetical protein
MKYPPFEGGIKGDFVRFKLLLLLALICVNSWLNSTTWHIKQDGTGNFTTIQEGIDASANTDTVLVYPGTYYENIIYNGKNITVASLELITGNATYIDSTVIDGQRITSCVRLINEETNTCLRGFTITNGQGEDEYPNLGGGLTIWGEPEQLIQCDIISCIFTDNYGKDSAGMHIKDGNVFLSGTSIRENYAYLVCGGICIADYSQVIFDSINRCNIYDNFAATGLDIFVSGNHIDEINVVVDTFTIINPTQYFAQYYNFQYINPYNFSIINYSLEQVNHDLYVSPDGNDNNDGLTPDEPMKTINLAVRKIVSDSLNPKTIHLASGTYNQSNNQQLFAIGAKSYINIEGEDLNTTIIDGEHEFLKLLFIGFGTTNCKIDNISFENAFSTWGAIAFSKCSNLSFSNLNISNIYSYKYSAINGYGADSNLEFKNVNVMNNISEQLYCGALFNGVNNSISFQDCSFINNYIMSSQAYCAGLQFQCNGSVEINNCIFQDNYINNTSSNDGICALAIAPHNSEIGDVKISNSLFEYNTAISSTTILSCTIYEPSELDITNCTIVDNTSQNTCTLIGDIALNNTILRNDCNNEIVLWDVTGNGIINELDISHCNIQGGQNAIYNQNGVNIVNWLEGNIDEDPMFDSLGTYPFALLEGSPCIDTGTPDTTGLFLPPWDLLHNHRVWDGDGNGTAIIDMGCYEFGAEPYVGITNYQLPVTDYHLTNYPNPFNPETKIVFNLPESGNVKLEIYNIKGQKVKTLLDCYMNPGRSEMIWDGKDDNGKRVGSGVYFYQLQTPDQNIYRKMLLLK